MRQQIPNIITLLNLFLGCLAIVSCFQFGTVASISESGDMLIEIPEKLYLASLFIVWLKLNTFNIFCIEFSSEI